MSLDIDRCLVDILIPSGVNLEKLSHIIDEYQHLIDTNLLWVRSDKPVQLADATRLLTVVKQFEPHPAAKVFASFWANTVKATTLPCNFLPFDHLSRSRCHTDIFIRRITALSSSISGSNAMRLWPTLQGVCYTVFAALPSVVCIDCHFLVSWSLC